MTPESPLAAGQFCPGVTLIYGPNGIGKSTLGRALTLSYAKPASKLKKAVIDAKILMNGDPIEAELRADVASYRPDGRFSRVESTSADSYFVNIAKLLNDAVDTDFERIVLQEMSGGISIAEAAKALKPSWNGIEGFAAQVKEARSLVDNLVGQQAEVARREASIKEIDEQMEELRSNRNEIDRLKNIALGLELLDELQKAKRGLDAFNDLPSALSIYPNLESLQELQRAQIAAETSLASARSRLTEVGGALTMSVHEMEVLLAALTEDLENWRTAEREAENAKSFLLGAESEQKHFGEVHFGEKADPWENAPGSFQKFDEDFESYLKAVAEWSSATEVAQLLKSRLVKEDGPSPQAELHALEGVLNVGSTPTEVLLYVGLGAIGIFSLCGLMIPAFHWIFDLLAALCAVGLIVYAITRRNPTQSIALGDVQKAAEKYGEALGQTRINDVMGGELERWDHACKSSDERVKARRDALTKTALGSQLSDSASASYVSAVARSTFEFLRLGAAVEKAKAEAEAAAEALTTAKSAALAKLRQVGIDAEDLATARAESNGLRKRIEAAREESQLSLRAEEAATKLNSALQALGLKSDDISAWSDLYERKRLRDLANEAVREASAKAGASDQAVTLAEEALKSDSSLDAEALKFQADQLGESPLTEQDLVKQRSEIVAEVAAMTRGKAVVNALDEYERKLAALNDVEMNRVRGAALDGLQRALESMLDEGEQPVVLSKTNDYLAQFTQNRYRIQWRPGGAGKDKSQILAIEDGAKSRSLSELSDGTRTQTLIAVRLALIETIEAGGLKLPIVLDEALATSDSRRTDDIISAVGDIARSGRQVFVLTARSDEPARWKARLDAKVEFQAIDLSKPA